LQAEISRLQMSLIQAQNTYDRLGMFVLSRQAQLNQGQLTLARLVGQIRKQYQDLGDDTSVKTALTALNQDSPRKYALGPLEDYQANVMKWARGVLEKEGFKIDRRGRLKLTADEELQSAVTLYKTVRMELATTLASQIDLKQAA